jgi:uncharacterized membrane protein YhaH (DUF805 family)
MLEFLFSPTGRIGRGQWWLAALLQLVLIVFLFGTLVGGIVVHSFPMLALSLILCFPAIWIGICANIKRYHDRDKSAWWLLVNFVPVIGGLWMLIELGFLRGTDGSNTFGMPGGAMLSSGYEIDEPAGVHNAGLAKIDDEYFKRKLAETVTAAPRQQSVAASGAAKPVFGRRA